MKISQIGISGTGGALAILTVWILKSYGMDVPEEVAVAFGTLFGSLTSWFKTR